MIFFSLSHSLFFRWTWFENRWPSAIIQSATGKVQQSPTNFIKLFCSFHLPTVTHSHSQFIQFHFWHNFLFLSHFSFRENCFFPLFTIRIWNLKKKIRPKHRWIVNNVRENVTNLAHVHISTNWLKNVNPENNYARKKKRGKKFIDIWTGQN